MWQNPQFPENLGKVTDAIFDGRFQFLRSVEPRREGGERSVLLWGGALFWLNRVCKIHGLVFYF